MERNSVFFVAFCCFFVSSALINKGVVNIHFCFLIPVRCTDNNPFNSIYLLAYFFFFVCFKSTESPATEGQLHGRAGGGSQETATRLPLHRPAAVRQTEKTNCRVRKIKEINGQILKKLFIQADRTAWKHNLIMWRDNPKRDSLVKMLFEVVDNRHFIVYLLY